MAPRSKSKQKGKKVREIMESRVLEEGKFPEVYVPTAAELKRAGFTGKALSREEYDAAVGRLRKSVLGDLDKAGRGMRLKQLQERHRLTPAKVKKEIEKIEKELEKERMKK